MKFDTEPALKRDLAVGFISGLGIAVFLTMFFHLSWLGAVSEGALVLVLGTFLLSAPLVAGGFYLMRKNFTPGEALRVAGWVLLGSGPIIVFTVSLIVFRNALDLVLDDPFLLLSGLVGLGALAGFLFGLYELELKNAKRTAQQTANRLEAIISGSPIPIIALEPDGTVTMWNRAAEETFGYEPAEVVGSTYPLAPPDREDEIEAHLQQVRRGEELLGTETVRERKDGVKLDVEIWTTRLGSEPADFRGVVALIADISERKRREQELQVLHRILRHNLRNDLNVIHGTATRIDTMLSPVAEGFDEESLAEAVETPEEDSPSAGESPSTLGGKLGRAIEFSRMLQDAAEGLISVSEKAQQAEYVLRTMDGDHHSVTFSEILESPVEDLRQTHDEADIAVEIQSSDPVLVRGPVSLAVKELAENAIVHHTDPQPAISIRAYANRERAYVEIADDGPGIPEEERHVIAAGEESSMIHSSGLGLWIAKWIVNRAGGSLVFDDGRDEGTTALIELPIAGEPTS
jgi:PAS domain S-box-containing protein